MEITEELRNAIRQVVREELELERRAGPKMGRCAFCGGEFPEDALNHSSGDPACAPCQKVFDPKPPPKTGR